jgi:alpha-L-fucosidase
LCACGKTSSELHVKEYYNRFPEGLVNNRWETSVPADLLENQPDIAPGIGTESHHGFLTPEYSNIDHITDYKWETCRCLGFSFGYNQNEGPG